MLSLLAATKNLTSCEYCELQKYVFKEKGFIYIYWSCQQIPLISTLNSYNLECSSSYFTRLCLIWRRCRIRLQDKLTILNVQLYTYVHISCKSVMFKDFSVAESKEIYSITLIYTGYALYTMLNSVCNLILHIYVSSGVYSCQIHFNFSP